MTVSEQIVQVLDALCEKFGIAIDWTSEHVIPYIGELCTKLVSWEIWTSVAWMVIMAVLVMIGAVIVKKLHPIFKKRIEAQTWCQDDWTIGWVFIIIGLVLLCLVAGIVIMVQTMDIIKCVTFPEMFVFEYVQNVINGGTHG